MLLFSPASPVLPSIFLFTIIRWSRFANSLLDSLKRIERQWGWDRWNPPSLLPKGNGVQAFHPDVWFPASTYFLLGLFSSDSDYADLGRKFNEKWNVFSISERFQHRSYTAFGKEKNILYILHSCSNKQRYTDIHVYFSLSPYEYIVYIWDFDKYSFPVGLCSPVLGDSLLGASRASSSPRANLLGTLEIERDDRCHMLCAAQLKQS